VLLAFGLPVLAPTPARAAATVAVVDGDADGDQFGRFDVDGNTYGSGSVTSRPSRSSDGPGSTTR
jgi:hypothetical protein